MAAPDESQALLTLQRELIVELREQLTLLHSPNAELRSELHAARNERALRTTQAGEVGQTPLLPTLEELERAAEEQNNPGLRALLRNLGAGLEG